MMRRVTVAGVTWAETRGLVADFEASLFKGSSALGGRGGGEGRKNQLPDF
jgi:hypothetical protein